MLIQNCSRKWQQQRGKCILRERRLVRGICSNVSFLVKHSLNILVTLLCFLIACVLWYWWIYSKIIVPISEWVSALFCFILRLSQILTLFQEEEAGTENPRESLWRVTQRCKWWEACWQRGVVVFLPPTLGNVTDVEGAENWSESQVLILPFFTQFRVPGVL